MSEVSLAPPPHPSPLRVAPSARPARPPVARNVLLFLIFAALSATLTAGVGPHLPPADILERPAAAVRIWVESRIASLGAIASRPTVTASRPLPVPDVPAAPVVIAGRLTSSPVAAASVEKPAVDQRTEVDRRPRPPEPPRAVAAKAQARVTPPPRDTPRPAAPPSRESSPPAATTRAAVTPPRPLASEPSRSFDPGTVGMAADVERTPVRNSPAPPAASPAPPALATATSGAAVQPPRAVTTQLASDESDVRRLIERYRGAYERLDANAAAQVWPSVDRRALARAFSDLESQTMRFDYCKVDVSSGRGLVSCKGLASYVGRVGNRAGQAQERQWTFVVRKNGEDWNIQSVRAQ